MVEAAGERHRGHVNSGHLCRDHRLGFILWRDTPDHRQHEVSSSAVKVLANGPRVEHLRDQALGEVDICRAERIHQKLPTGLLVTVIVPERRGLTAPVDPESWAGWSTLFTQDDRLDRLAFLRRRLILRCPTTALPGDTTAHSPKPSFPSGHAAC
jgi:hypothetical protein